MAVRANAPMKAKDLGHLVDWGGEQPFAALERYFTADYAMEPKLDGVRVQLTIGERGSRLATSSIGGGADRTANFPHLAALTHPDLIGCVLDGELISATPRLKGRSGWTNSLLNASTVLATSSPATAVALQRRHGVAQLWAFDLLAGPGQDLRRQPWAERRAALELVVELLQLGNSCSARGAGTGCDAGPKLGNPRSATRHSVNLVEQLPACAESITATLEAGFEGVVIKKRSARYVPGSRAGEWLKIKTRSTADAFIVGYEPGSGSWRGQVGSVQVALRKPDGSDYPVAAVGNLSPAMRIAFSAPDGSLKPEWYGRVVEFSAQGIGSGGRARHPLLVRVRPDKTPEDCGLDQIGVFPRV